MRINLAWLARFTVAGLGMLLAAADSSQIIEERLARHRNLGKAFYENPTTKKQAVEELGKALELTPDSARERLNYGLALLRAGKSKEGIAEIEKVQKQDPSIPHTWFNLGVEYKKLGNFDEAITQFEQMVKLVPAEPISQYNLGALYKLSGMTEEAVSRFEIASQLDPSLAAPHFQLFNIHRQGGRKEKAAERLKLFQVAKKRQKEAVIPEDVGWSVYSELYDIVDPASDQDTAFHAELEFEDRKLPGVLNPEAAGLLTLDANGDGRVDLLAWSSDGVRLYRNGRNPVRDDALAALEGATSVEAGDFDNDGLADLCVLTPERPVLLRNTKGGFRKHEARLPSGNYHKAVWLDYDHDNDLDLFLLGANSVLMRNQGSAGFADRTADFPFVEGEAIDAVTFRIVPDTKALDLVVTYADTGGYLYEDKLGGKYVARSIWEAPATSRGLVAADVDNNGWVDLAFSVGGRVVVLLNREGSPKVVEIDAAGAPLFADLENRGRVELLVGDRFYRNRGEGRFSDAQPPAGLVDGSVWVRADFNNDGRVDLATVAKDGSVHLLRNQTATRNKWLRVTLNGRKAMKLAPGAEVEVRTATRYQKKTYRGVPLLFGLRSDARVDMVRITWPNGLIQNEVKQAANKAHSYKEEERLSGSCPMIWSWNGREFQYITDVLGVAPLGASAGDGTYFPTDHDEYIQIPGEALAVVDGNYEIRITEELSEVSYLDQVKLIAVDHPADVDVFTSEKFQGPPFPEFRLFGVRQRIYPKAARDGEGRRVLSRLLKRDRRYPDEFPRGRMGVAGLHTLELDFGLEAAPRNNAVLVLNGWVDWADGSTFLSRAQEADGGLLMPYLQVRDARGEWQTVIEDMGIPAGKPKTIVVDLNGKFRSRERQVRIVTNLCVYWDEIFLAEDATAPPVRLTPATSHSAELLFRGFSRVRIHPRRKQPEMFFYPQPRPASMWNPTPGYYTHYGGVRELLAEIDDRFVIMGSGDEVRLLFDARALPALEPGWKRDFLLLVDGWAKDRDSNTAYSQTVEPLPFHGMSGYPYPAAEHYPDGELHRSYRDQYNTRPALRLLRPLTPRAGHAGAD